MEVQENKKRSVDFSLKATWLAISKMYNTIGSTYDVTHSTGFVLLNIDKEFGTPATKIAPLMGMEARSLTRMLKTMEEKGLIRRVADENDKRKVIIKLTEEGKVKREMSRQTVKAFHSKLKDVVTEEKLDVFFEVIENINNLIENPHNGIAEELYHRLAELAIVDKEVLKKERERLTSMKLL
ncbi:MarR family transcriptional regulator [Rapidithrix thailandica]|uniref:MarR family transcriptional regulator n=1 Tax=Rapidithrix thailandica TaxID=413964 RepID=A0AAW9RVI2_9BACT